VKKKIFFNSPELISKTKLYLERKGKGLYQRR